MRQKIHLLLWVHFSVNAENLLQSEIQHMNKLSIHCSLHTRCYFYCVHVLNILSCFKVSQTHFCLFIITFLLFHYNIFSYLDLCNVLHVVLSCDPCHHAFLGFFFLVNYSLCNLQIFLWEGSVWPASTNILHYMISDRTEICSTYMD